MLQNISFFGRYVLWHYTRAFTELAQTGANLLWFIGHFFSLGTLVRTFFAPWKLMAESYPSIIDIGQFFETLIVNTLMRAVGIIMRSFLLVIGIITLLAGTLCYILAFIVWILLPLLLILSVSYGITLLFL